jgi:glycosyltransferase involved in cell wall biosynthesis
MTPQEFPAVDVCMITYNQVSLVEETIQSVLDQDYPNVTIIVSDDCSTDGTQAVLTRLAQRHPEKIRIHLNERNRGITLNSNYVLAQSSTQYVIVFSGDDLMHQDRISKQIRHLQAHPDAAGCMSNVVVYDVTTQQSRVAQFPDFEFENFLKILATYNQVPSASLMINRKIFGEVRYDVRTPVVSDWLLVNEVAFKGLVYLNEPLTTYRRHPTNTTLRGVDKTYLDDRLVAIDILFSKLQAHYWKFRNARSNVFLSVATRYWHGGAKRESLKFVIYAFLEYPFNKELYLLPLKLLKKND